MIYDTLLAAAEKQAPDSGASVNVEIKAGDALADEIDDLREARSGELRKIRISLGNPSVTVDLWRGVSGTSMDPVSQELALGIRDHINARRSLFVGLSTLPSLYTLPLGLGLSSVPGIWASRAHLAEAVGVTLAAVVVTLILAAVVNVVLAYRFGEVRVVPRKENEARGLGAETRKQLMIAVVGAIIIGLAGFWAGAFVHH